MDASSQEKLVQNSNSLANGQNVSELNHDVKSNCSYDEQVLKNNENMGNVQQLEPNEENGNKELIQRKRGRPRKKENIIIGSPRVLRSRSHEKPKIPESVDVLPSQDEDAESKENKRKKMKRIKKDENNEFSKIKTHLRYLLHRMRYEQNFIEAYAGEGWKGQSLEKLRPEKELDRAKSDINRYKLRIRNLFQKIETSCEEGRIPESLYDSEGLIDSEDIFCAKCGQKDVRLDNDIILCDGTCERGFHQFCLDPPLLKEQVPPGDEGWLCPACECKVDCFDLLNDSQGTNLSMGDKWEKVFPETASGNNLDNNSGLPSDDSGDDDYNPDGRQLEDEVDAEDSSSDESDFSSASEDLAAVANNNNNNDPILGLPSDDSEDDDFNPDKVDSDDEEAKLKSSSSDFTSDSDDLADISKNEVTSAEVGEPKMCEKDEDLVKENIEDDDCGPITAKRHVERLDYKKLHDEAYGNFSSDSSDEDFDDYEGPKRGKNSKKTKDVDINKKEKEENENESTPIRKTSSKMNVEGTSAQMAVGSSDKSGTKSQHRRLGEAATQGLYASFKENQYPTRNVRENLAKELNLTFNQVSKWFDNARWSFNHPGKRTKTVSAASGKGKSPTENLIKKQENEATPVSETPMASSTQTTTRRSGRVQAKRL